MSKLGLKEMDLKNRRVLMRVDFNVPLKDGKILDDTRIEESLASIRYILEQGASLVLMSHMGSPKGEKNKEFSLAPCAKRLSEKLGVHVQMAPDCIGEEVKKLKSSLKPKEILLLENLRFCAAEEKPEKDPLFAKELASLGDCYVDDAFGSAHRAHASIVEVPKFFPKSSGMGFLMEKEVRVLSELIQNPKRPFYAILGGAKVSSKIGLVEKLLEKVDALFIGGAMSFSFLKAKGVKIEDPLIEKLNPKMDLSKVYLPEDLIVTQDRKKGKEALVDQIPSGFRGVDLGPKTLQKWTQKLKQASTIFWNGPLGVFEVDAFAKGTEQIAKALCKQKAKVVVGGGDSVFAIHKMGLEKEFDHLSTGGGASLEFLERGSLPGVDALSEV